jgi:hypothetical protein
VAFHVRIEAEPRTIGPVSFVGPRSVMETFGPDSVVAFVRLEIDSVADLRQTIKNVEFHIKDPRVHRADGEAFRVTLEFPPAERPPGTPEPRE